MRQIKNVFVDGISLVSKEKQPAVQQAESKFALFKVKEKKEEQNTLSATCEEILKNLAKFSQK